MIETLIHEGSFWSPVQHKYLIIEIIMVQAEQSEGFLLAMQECKIDASFYLPKAEK